MAKEPTTCQSGTVYGRLAAWFRNQHRLVLCFPAGIAVFIATLRFADALAGPGLDMSWCQALTYFYKHNCQAGADYLFTYGPLGFLLTCLHDPDVFWLRFAWEVTMKAILAASFVALWIRLPGRVLPAASLIGFLALAPLLASESLYELLIVSATLVVIASRRLCMLSLLALAVVLTLLSLTKFTLALLSLLAMVSLCVSRLEERRPWHALSPALFMLFLLPVAWILLGQRLTNLPLFIRGSLQIAAGYPEGMAFAGDRREIRLAKVIVVLLVLSAMARRHAWNAPSLAAALLLAGACFMAWRHAVIRQDPAHSCDFFGCALVIAILLPASLPAINWKAPYRVAAIAYAGLLSCIGLMTDSNQAWDLHTYWPLLKRSYQGHWGRVAHPVQFQAALAERIGLAPATCCLPRIAGRVGNRTIDEISNEPAIVLLNHMNYRPRPIFQSYSAYTDYLLKANADYLAGPRAPDYLLVDLQALDMHLPTMEDGPALLEVLHRYRPVMLEKSRILLERRSGQAATLVRQKIGSLAVRFNEEVRLPPGEGQVLSLRIQETFEGACHRLLLRGDPLTLNILTSEGRRLSYRLIPGMAASGFLINPLVQNNEDLIHLYAAQSCPRAVAISVTSQSGKAYQSELTMTIESVPNLLPQTLTAQEIEDLQRPAGASKLNTGLVSASVPHQHGLSSAR
jgi:hypothetical protein